MSLIPECKEIEALAASYSVIPICKQIFADNVTPITLLRRIGALSKQYYLLESIEGGETWGRYSFLGFDPILKVSANNHKVTVKNFETTDNVQTETILKTDSPYDVLRDILTDYKSPKLPGLPPFTGGFVGYFAYRMIGYAEPKLSIKKGALNDFDLMLFDTVIAYDHLKQSISIVVNMKTDQVMENYGAACAKLEQISRMIHEETPLAPSNVKSRTDFQCSLSKDEYCQMVKKAKEYIGNGDIFQAVLSRTFTTPWTDSLLNPYRVLRTTNPSPYMVYLHMDSLEIISTSPETLVRLVDGRLTTFPVAGSRPRGKDAQEDKKLEEELLSDEKELAEHNMLVDLGRNDLGKISNFSTVEVTEYKMIHKYSRIMHICSQVEGNIKPDCDAFSAIEAVLPAGTLSGAPKIRACEIIEELEQEPRGIYGGALGYIDFTGNMDTCIAIRMAVKYGEEVTVQAGGGIVADSVPDLEYEESGHKAKAVIKALESAWEVND
ncbi:anthranilate synthase component I family protein [Clostridium sp. E02]|uniref:anthranilate synthase component I family protein n=1 Tax=Clostridium sp. E02 TaxID=2487134 RepID=UPI000F522411|nr:anthranilate synthase component I family protein [Clostridium sp. E02]